MATLEDNLSERVEIAEGRLEKHMFDSPEGFVYEVVVPPGTSQDEIKLLMAQKDGRCDLKYIGRPDPEIAAMFAREIARKLIYTEGPVINSF